MAFNERLAVRVRSALAHLPKVEEKRKREDVHQCGE